MKWIKFTINTTTEAVDFISAMLDEIGVEGIEIEDNVPLTEEEKKEMYIDIVPEGIVDDGKAVIHFYKEPEGCHPEDIIVKAEQGLSELSDFVDVGDGKVSFHQTDDIDWLNNWKQFFKPFRATDHIVIKPTWTECDLKNEDDILIEIDPGIAFGTGSHETTKLCIGSLEKYVTETTKVLDVGCGSGILSIAAIKLGAPDAVAIDIDPAAVTVTKENIDVNEIPHDKIKVYEGNLIEDTTLQDEVGHETYDIVVANILADVIIPLSSMIKQHMKKDGIFISSGIIYMKKEEVRTALLDNGFEIVETVEMGDWVSFVAKK